MSPITKLSEEIATAARDGAMGAASAAGERITSDAAKAKPGMILAPAIDLDPSY